MEIMLGVIFLVGFSMEIWWNFCLYFGGKFWNFVFKDLGKFQEKFPPISIGTLVEYWGDFPPISIDWIGQIFDRNWREFSLKILVNFLYTFRRFFQQFWLEKLWKFLMKSLNENFSKINQKIFSKFPGNCP